MTLTFEVPRDYPRGNSQAHRDAHLHFHGSGIVSLQGREILVETETITQEELAAFFSETAIAAREATREAEGEAERVAKESAFRSIGNAGNVAQLRAALVAYLTTYT